MAGVERRECLGRSRHSWRLHRDGCSCGRHTPDARLMQAPVAVGPTLVSRLGVVVIGRNEGERLRRCLTSVLGAGRTVVYVDSGSTDDSVALAMSLGAVVHQLDMGRPFTAARARNEGARRLATAEPRIDIVQFVDGDCEVVPGWLAAAAGHLGDRPEVAVVCGRRREQHPERSVYNLLCDLEWNTPIGLAKSCGGDAAIRFAALRESGGYRDSMIAGEEPELCVRLRARGWRIWRIDQEMTLHDAAILRFGQWWKRSVRAGYAYGIGAHLHGAPPERHWVRDLRSALFWGLVLPVSLLAAGAVLSGWSALGLLAYPLQMLRLFLRSNGSLRERLARSFFLVLGKFAEAAGAIRFMVHRASGANSRLIEYK